MESLKGNEYFNQLGSGTIQDPYKSVGAMRKETIKIGKSDRLFSYSKISMTFFLEKGKSHLIEEPF